MKYRLQRAFLVRLETSYTVPLASSRLLMKTVFFIGDVSFALGSRFNFNI